MEFRSVSHVVLKILGGLRGPKKILAIFQEASGGILGRDFTPPGGPGGRFGLHFGGSEASCRLSFWRLVLKMRKSQNLQTVHTKTLIFKVPEASRGTFFEAKIIRQTSWKPRARRSTFRASKNRSPSALGEPPGLQKYPSEVSQYCFGFEFGEQRLAGELLSIRY